MRLGTGTLVGGATGFCRHCSRENQPLDMTYLSVGMLICTECSAQRQNVVSRDLYNKPKESVVDTKTGFSEDPNATDKDPTLIGEDLPILAGMLNTLAELFQHAAMEENVDLQQHIYDASVCIRKAMRAIGG